MNAWIDRLIDLGLAADAECWRKEPHGEELFLLSMFQQQTLDVSWAGLGVGGGSGYGYDTGCCSGDGRGYGTFCGGGRGYGLGASNGGGG